ncbi:hypothetical protein ElyMa_006796400 [Elysia marginata]|uniref:Uncharacterized protein n=1 Tax=Elysia marginata TaxID=1093978 RepID=A0AAV4J687_9GAST|nr:hypothetical protein ElyMa_006796400 [Elysia marginata]
MLRPLRPPRPSHSLPNMPRPPSLPAAFPALFHHAPPVPAMARPLPPCPTPPRYGPPTLLSLHMSARQWREASATPSMASITSTDESFQYHGDGQQQRDHYNNHHHQQHLHHHHHQDDHRQYVTNDRDSPANSSKMSTNLLDSCL